MHASGVKYSFLGVGHPFSENRGGREDSRRGKTGPHVCTAQKLLGQVIIPTDAAVIVIIFSIALPVSLYIYIN